MDWVIAGGGDWLVGRLGAWCLVVARLLGLCLTAPGLAAPGVSWRFRLGLAGMLSLILFPILGARVTTPTDWAGAAWAGLGEGLIGTMLGMSAGLIVAGARAAGDLVAAQAGLATATLFDPESDDEATALGRLYGWVALAAFLGLGGPMALVRALADSYAVLPAGQSSISRRAAVEAFGQVGRALELSLRAAAPPAVALIMAGIALAWLARTAPSLPFLIMALPIRVVLGIALVILGLATMAMIFIGAWEGFLGLR